MIEQPVLRVSDRIINRLAEATNATILGMLLKRGYTKVYMEGVRTLATGRRLSGRAVTLKFLPSRPDLDERVSHSSPADFMKNPRWRALEALGPGDVLVADAMRRSNVSVGGDVIYSRILTKGGAGLVTDGAVRDGLKVAGFGFPVFGGASTPTVGVAEILPYSVGEPVQCGGVLVWPGDVILGDDEGVVVLPAQFAADVAEEAIEHDEIETALLEYSIRHNVPPSRYYPFNDETRKIYEEWKRPRRKTVPRSRRRQV